MDGLLVALPGGGSGWPSSGGYRVGVRVFRGSVRPSAYHPTPYGYRRRIAQWTGESGDVAGAVELLRALLVDLGRWQPPEHFGYLGARAEFAYWTVRLGDRKTGLNLLRELLPEMEQLL